MSNKSKNVRVVDLDGTLYNTNTFHRWLTFTFKKSLLTNPKQASLIVLYSLQRLLKKITHADLKYRILKLTEHYDEKIIIEFTDSLDKYKNKKVLDFLGNSETVYILSTAAPELYASEISRKHHFDYCVATPSTTAEIWYENIRGEKLKNTQDMLKEKKLNSIIEIMITDHHDDLPIMKLASQVILVNSSEKTKKILQNNNVDFFEL